MTYKAPLKDIEFFLKDVHGFLEHYRSLDIDLDDDLIIPILQEAAKFSEQELYPLNKVGDEEGVKCVDGKVITPTGFKQAYQAYVEGGWPSMAQPVNFGGQELPVSLSLVVHEMWHAANQAWGMYAVVTEGVATTLGKYGTEQQKELYLPKLVSGEWIGTMAISEPQAGSDVGLIKTRAVPSGDGSYRISGSKIFISSGDQDLSENVIHLVLGRLPGAPAGTRGLSLFVVPKFHANADGSLGAANTLGCSSVEHKMGLKGSATCAMFFDDAQGYLIGEENRGLMSMFTLINKSRLGVAVQAQAQADGAYQMSLSYANDRLQGRSPVGERSSGGDAIVDHPDVQRMLNTQRVFAEASRGLIYEGIKLLDVSSLGSDPASSLAEKKLSLMTPILKGCISEWGCEAADLGVQIFGGHGYTKDWGIEQRLRDVRVTRIYEGTTGIQAQDFLLRKVLPDTEAAFQLLYEGFGALAQRTDLASEIQTYVSQLSRLITDVKALTEVASSKQGEADGTLESIAYDYMMLNGYILLAYQTLKIAAVATDALSAASSDEAYLQSKIELMNICFKTVLPKTQSHFRALEICLEG